jgi:hypothetical protein
LRAEGRLKERGRWKVKEGEKRLRPGKRGLRGIAYGADAQRLLCLCVCVRVYVCMGFGMFARTAGLKTIIIVTGPRRSQTRQRRKKHLRYAQLANDASK